MKVLKLILSIFIFFTLATINNFAQEITLTTTEKNLTASKATIDMAGLAGNPQAIIVATPLGETAKLNQHPIGAWYYGGKWNIFNTDHSTMPAGLNFKLQVFLKPDASHFLQIVTKENLVGDASYIDNSALKNNPNAKIIIFQNHAPDIRTAYLNKYEAIAEYDPTVGKWYIKNVNGERLFPDTAYNVVISSIPNFPKLSVQIPELIIRSQVNTTSNSTCDCPTSLPPDGNASGDLGGTYPNPTVRKLLGKPISSNAPAIGQIMKWNGTEWIPADDNVAATNSTPSATVIKPSVLFYNQSADSVDESPIPGLDGQSFTLAQNSRIVFHTVIAAQNQNYNSLTGAFTASSIVEILNASNGVVARISTESILGADLQYMNTNGIGVLPAGTYHTRVSMKRASGRPLTTRKSYSTIAGIRQGGQMIIEIFPD